MQKSLPVHHLRGSRVSRGGIPLSGTMAHSFVEASDSKQTAFTAFAKVIGL
jgi:nicotinic acid phosphoribosyltransferase